MGGILRIDERQRQMRRVEEEWVDRKIGGDVNRFSVWDDVFS